mmetsp:Transcript_23168/g.69244  ORF Transcript_23168/g.69244 Transcript_23168/m.69244 type:complete len:95 (+) Transcript_23168:421-705(+)
MNMNISKHRTGLATSQLIASMTNIFGGDLFAATYALFLLQWSRAPCDAATGCVGRTARELSCMLLKVTDEYFAGHKTTPNGPTRAVSPFFVFAC